ncbi:MAG: hypothetical protein HZB14_04785 [Actinobacteria bacterium]|nr:hypothetical protein [Actinomycetota bacterium]
MNPRQHSAKQALSGSMGASWLRRLLPVVLCPLVAASVAYAYGQSISHTYEAKAEVSIALSKQQIARQRVGRGEPLTAESLAQSWAEIPSYAAFREQVAAMPGVNYTPAELKAGLRGRSLIGSNRILISARSSSSSQATLIAQQASKNLLIWVDQWPRHPATAKIETPAREPGWPVDPDIPNAVLVAAVIGLSLGSIAAMLIPASPAAGSRRVAAPA